MFVELNILIQFFRRWEVVDLGTSKKMLDGIFVTNITAAHIHLAVFFILMLIYMLNIYSFYRTGALTL